MSFCKTCGRQLQEGETCGCEADAQALNTGGADSALALHMKVSKEEGLNVNEFLFGLWALIVGLFKAPVSTIHHYIENPKISYAYTLVGVRAFIFAFTAWFSQMIYNSTHAYASYSNIEMIKRFFTNMIGTVAAASLSGLVIMLIIESFTKKKTDFAVCIGAASLSAVYLVPAKLISSFLSYINISLFTEFGTGVTSFANAAGIVLVCYGIRAICKKEDSLPLIVGGSVAAAGFAFYMVGLVFQL